MHFKSSKPRRLAIAACLACLHLSNAWSQSETKYEATFTKQLAELSYPSVFENYQRYSASPLHSWQQANDTVQDIGGWRADAKEVTPSPSHGGHP